MTFQHQESERPLIWMLDDEWNDHSSIEKHLVDQGFAFHWTNSGRLQEECPRYAPQAVGLLLQVGFPCPVGLLDQLTQCRGIVVTGTGYDNVDLQAAAQRKILVACVADYCTQEVALHAISLLLSLARRLPEMDRQVRSGQWDTLAQLPYLRRPTALTLGVLGCGRIGRRVARLAHGLGLSVLASDARGVPEALQCEGVVPVSLDALLAQSDYLSIHLPLTEQTQGLLDRAAFAKMRRGAVLINTSRAAIVDEEALLEALDNGTLSAAGLDVFWEEPLPPHHPLCRMQQVILSPHAAYVSREAIEELWRRACENVVALVRGESVADVVNVGL